MRQRKAGPVTILAYSIADAAAAVGVSRWTIYRLLRSGELDGSRVRGRVVVMADSIARMLEAGRREFINSV